MSAPTFAASGFADWDDDLEFAALVERFDDPKPVRRPSRSCAERQAVNEALGIRRHRRNERES